MIIRTFIQTEFTIFDIKNIWRSVEIESDVHVTVHRDKFLIIKPNRCTNFSNLFLEWNSTCFGQFLCQSSGVFHCTHSNGICHKGLLTVCEQDQDVPSWYCSEFHSKNKFEKLVHLVCFTIRKVVNESRTNKVGHATYTFEAGPWRALNKEL